MKVVGADIVYEGEEGLHGIELKLYVLNCVFGKERGAWSLRRKATFLYKLEYDMLTKGGWCFSGCG